MTSLQAKKDMWLFDYQDFKGDPEGLKNIRIEEKKYYLEVLEKVIANPRLYLDNLDNLQTFYVSFIDYSYKKSKGL